MFKDLQTEFGRQVRNARIKRGLTQGMTAELLEISCSNLRKIEQGKGNSSWEVWMKLTGLFDIDLEGLQAEYIPQSIQQLSKIENLSSIRV